MGSSQADDTATGTAASEGVTPGQRVVFAIYAASIATAAVFGLVLGFMLEGQNGPTTGSFGPVTFPITPVTLAVFGTVMVGFMLTIGLLLVRAASRYEGRRGTE